MADTATTAIAANNVGNASVMKGLVVFDVISILTEDKGPRKFYHPMEMYTVSDDKTGELFEVPKADMYVFGVDMAEVGDRLRVIVSKSKKVTVYNLTKNPELEEKTR
ncbi:hypothetical protein KYG_18266 [Acidovorax sp. NO-1]|nr:hypothetical protein KYG_18266 [Acidovorax sp. NO-1]